MDRRTLIVVMVVAASALASGGLLHVMLRPATPAAGSNAAPGVRPLDRMAERLSARLAKDGGSAADWALLGRSYREMARWPEAVGALERSLALAPDPQVEADLAAARAKAAAR